MKTINLKDVIKAQQNFDKKAVKITPLEYNQSLSKQFEANIYLKREDLQLVRSYKIRGSFNLISNLSNKEKSNWVVAASAWNHAQWVALSCKIFKIKWTIFMPQTTPSQKIRKTKVFGGEFVEIILIWDSFDETYKNAIEYATKNKKKFIHPFDDYMVMTGQATVWLEIINEFKDWKIDFLLVPIWGWWLAAWTGSVFKQLSSRTRLIWVEAENAAWMHTSLNNNKITTLNSANTIAEWTAVKTVWKNTFEICKKIIDEIVLVPDWHIATIMLKLLDDQWIILEWAWALSIAALNSIKNKIKWKNVVCVLSWGNFDFSKLPEIQEKSLKFEGQKRYFIISFPQRPWALKEFLDILWDEDDIVFFEYIKKSAKERWPALVWLESTDKKSFEKIIQKMKKHNIMYEDITNNPMYFEFLI